LTTRIRAVQAADLPFIHDIEAGSFREPYPSALITTLYTRYPRSFLVAEHEGRVVGYVIASTYKDRAHVVSIAVAPDARRKKIGHALLRRLLQLLRELRVLTVRLEVRQSNRIAQRFYERRGFQYSHTVAGYYPDEDGLVYFKGL
jgi:ribosomal-protein-alanine N-acetyltransferase